MLFSLVKLCNPNIISIQFFRYARAKYNSADNIFIEKDIKVKEPWNIFEKWYEDAKNYDSIIEPHASCLSTAKKDGVPSGRLMLCQSIGKDGFKFFTHYTSRKGHELEENPRAALTFFWAPLSRSVRVEGLVERLPISEADDYFNTRPRSNQIGTACSNQSHPIESRNILTNKIQELIKMYPERKQVPRPKQWVGYVLKPYYFEFWHGQSDRVHDRIIFRKATKDFKPDNKLTHHGVDGWIYYRLSP